VPWVYLLRCADDSLYCGWTVDLDKRLAAHNAGTGSRYTRRRLPVALAWSQEHPDRSSAMRAEAAIKQLSRPEKLALLNGTGSRPFDDDRPRSSPSDRQRH
jgi:putative endonuclease